MEQVSGIILAGGQSKRMGRNKTLLMLRGEPLVQRVAAVVGQVAADVVVVTPEPQHYGMLSNARFSADRYAGAGPLAGLHAGLLDARHGWAVVVAADMPYLNADVLRYLLSLAGDDVDAVVPRTEEGVHPLHAVYHKRCLPAIEARLQAGKRQVVSFYDAVRVRSVDAAELTPLDPRLLTFCNVNTQAEWQQVLDDLGAAHG